MPFSKSWALLCTGGFVDDLLSATTGAPASESLFSQVRRAGQWNLLFLPSDAKPVRCCAALQLPLSEDLTVQPWAAADAGLPAAELRARLPGRAPQPPV